MLAANVPAARASAATFHRDDSSDSRASSGMIVSGRSPSPSDRAPNFELKDQYDKAYTYRFPKDRVSVLAFGDRKGSAQIEGWIRPLVERYGGRIDISGVAELSAVPSLSRGLVRRIFKSRVKYPVMLDWSGEVSKDYGYRGGRAGIFLINREGHIVATKSGAASGTELKTLYEQIDRLLK